MFYCYIFLFSFKVLKKAQSAIESRIRAAYDWLDDGFALRGGLGEKSLRQIVEQAQRLAERYLPPSQAESLQKLTSQIVTMTNALCELRQNEKGLYNAHVYKCKIYFINIYIFFLIFHNIYIYF